MATSATEIDLAEVLLRLAQQMEKLDDLSAEVETAILRIAQSCAAPDVPSRELQMIDRLRQDKRDLAAFARGLSRECGDPAIPVEVFTRLLQKVKQAKLRQILAEPQAPASGDPENGDMTLF